MNVGRVGNILGVSIVALALASSPAYAQEARPAQDDHKDIIVEGSRDVPEKQIETLSRTISQRPRAGKPLAKQYGEICLAVVGLARPLALDFIDRVENNAERIGVRIAKRGCVVNSFIGFTNDSKKEFLKLRETQPWLFEELHGYEINRITRGSGAAQVWHSTEVTGREGRQFGAITMPDGSSVAINKTLTATRMAEQIRVELGATVMLIDSRQVVGKSIPQLADYATMRLLASVDDLAEAPDGSVDSILGLFSEGGGAPVEMTEFDWSYLRALYRLPENALGNRIHDETTSAFKRGETGAPKP